MRHQRPPRQRWPPTTTSTRCCGCSVRPSTRPTPSRCTARPRPGSTAPWPRPAGRAQAAPLAALPPAVIMDIDETVLDNSPYQARLVAGGGEYDEATWSGWVEERKARPVPGVLEFARAAQARGVTILYLSNRA